MPPEVADPQQLTWDGDMAAREVERHEFSFVVLDIDESSMARDVAAGLARVPLANTRNLQKVGRRTMGLVAANAMSP